MDRKTSPSALEHHLGFWLRVLSNHVHHGFEQKLARFDVSVAQWVTLRRLFEAGEISITELAIAVGVDQGAMSRMVDRLRARGFVQRQADPNDGRAKRLKLTAEGKRLVPLLAGAADQNDREVFSVLSARERTELRGLIEKLIQTHKAPINANE